MQKIMQNCTLLSRGALDSNSIDGERQWQTYQSKGLESCCEVPAKREE
jgi:hypothetical protein